MGAVCLSVHPHFRSHAEMQTELRMHGFNVCFETKEAVLLVERLTCIRRHHLITSLMVKWRLLRRIPETVPPERLQRSTTVPLAARAYTHADVRGAPCNPRQALLLTSLDLVGTAICEEDAVDTCARQGFPPNVL